ncbi:hypothetical protein RRG08_025018 [Elysia crispata]|uniref:Uncharacterized protein n=1 Tax=Elysia crispata TaxID=231223 RepID=A0AAE1ANW4_9GAST|nr:hypothetical protein RRG08_025018 [Elysia crispata]
MRRDKDRVFFFLSPILGSISGLSSHLLPSTRPTDHVLWWGEVFIGIALNLDPDYNGKGENIFSTRYHCLRRI